MPIPPKMLHKDKIEGLCYNSLSNRETNDFIIQKAILTASEDKSIKIWDRSSGNLAFTLRYNN